MNEIAYGKARAIRDAVRRIREVDPGSLEGLQQELLLRESVILNLQHACQCAIDLALHLVGLLGLGEAKDSRDAFRRLEEAGHVEATAANHLRGMVGFRNLAVHQYHALDLTVVRAILDQRLTELLNLADLGEKLAENG